MARITSFNDFITENPTLKPFVVPCSVYGGSIAYNDARFVRGFDISGIPVEDRPVFLRGLWYVILGNEYRHYNAMTEAVINRYVRRYKLPIDTEHHRKEVAEKLSQLMGDVTDNCDGSPKRAVYWRSKGGKAVTGSEFDIRIHLRELYNYNNELIGGKNERPN